MVWADELNPGNIIRSMEAGRFYSSSGVTLKSVKATKQDVSVTVKPEDGVKYTVEFVGTMKADLPTRDALKGTTRNWNPNIGKRFSEQQLTSGKATYKFTGDEIYVRARITSTRRHPNPGTPGEMQQAWTQPVKGPSAPAQD